MPEASARRGTASDLLWLARLYEKLDRGRRHSLICIASRLAAARGADHPGARDGIGASADIEMRKLVGLLAAYCKLDFTSKGDVLTQAAELVAAQVISTQAAASPSPDEISDWLTRLAKDCAPRDGLVAWASNYSLNAYEALFNEGALATALCPSENELALGEGVYAGYVMMKEDHAVTDDGMPDPPKVLGVNVPTRNFKEWDGKRWIVNESAWEAEVRGQCVVKCADLVANWRSTFFEALLAGSPVR